MWKPYLIERTLRRSHGNEPPSVPEDDRSANSHPPGPSIDRQLLATNGGAQSTCEGAGCDEEQLEYINTWKGQGADAVAAEAARIEDLLSEETQKKMKKQTKLLAKVSKLAHDEL